jgi:acyl-CoA thioester hydrolase
LSHLGLEQDRLASAYGVVFVVRRVAADYLRPARFNDRLVVSSALVEVNRVSLAMSQQVWRGDELLLEATVKVACVGQRDFRPARIPTFVTQAFTS